MPSTQKARRPQAAFSSKAGTESVKREDSAIRSSFAMLDLDDEDEDDGDGVK